jgi:hypothetical protein
VGSEGVRGRRNILGATLAAVKPGSRAKYASYIGCDTKLKEAERGRQNRGDLTAVVGLGLVGSVYGMYGWSGIEVEAPDLLAVRVDTWSGPNQLLGCGWA